jgi:hypothetical protein
MRLVSENEPGVNIQLHPNKSHLTYFEICEDGKQLLLTGNRVERVDKPSPRLQEVMNAVPIYPDSYDPSRGFGAQELPENEPYFLVIETKEPPSPPRADPTEMLRQELADLDNPLNVVMKHLESLDLTARKQLLVSEAATLGIELAPAEARVDLEEVELTDKRILAGTVTRPVVPNKQIPEPRKETR